MSSSDAELYSRLEAVVAAHVPEGVTYRIRLQPDEIDQDGWFSPAPHNCPPPQIGIYRPQHQDVPGDVLQELLTLAHEFGHFRSFVRSFVRSREGYARRTTRRPSKSRPTNGPIWTKTVARSSSRRKREPGGWVERPSKASVLPIGPHSIRAGGSPLRNTAVASTFPPEHLPRR